jgi:ribosomal protein L11 methyltransferase
LSSPAGFKLRLKVPAAAVTIFEAAFQALGGAVARDAGDSRAETPLEVYLKGQPDRAEVAAALAAAAAAAGLAPPPVTFEALPALDWVAESQKGLPPLRVGRFFIYGSHAAAERPAAAIAIRIDAGQAFGTGHHESTRGCLLALDALARRGRPGACLDLGCGSGILAIAMAKLWRRPVLACDIDPLAVAVTRENARVNQVAPAVRAVLSDGPGRRPVVRSGPYDVIVANILAAPLAAMAGDLRRALAPSGCLVLSGLLRHQDGAIVARYRARGLRLIGRMVLGEWVTLVLSR